jgi:8-oxo-dGTP diphosphatase
MSYRAAIILIKGDKVSLIERHRQGLHYFTFPGGHVEAGETPEQAAVRETREELGMEVVITKLVAKSTWQGHDQYYFLVKHTGGLFGTGSGDEILHPPPEKGTYRPIWMPVASLLDLAVRPRGMAELTVKYWEEGWPEDIVLLCD